MTPKYGADGVFAVAKVTINYDKMMTEKMKLIPENIREGITILGVPGTMSGNEDSKPQSREVEAPLTEDLTVLPEDGYNCLSQVIVKKVPYQTIDNTADGKGITVKIGG